MPEEDGSFFSGEDFAAKEMELRELDAKHAGSKMPMWTPDMRVSAQKPQRGFIAAIKNGLAKIGLE